MDGPLTGKKITDEISAYIFLLVSQTTRIYLLIVNYETFTNSVVDNYITQESDKINFETEKSLKVCCGQNFLLHKSNIFI